MIYLLLSPFFQNFENRQQKRGYPGNVRGWKKWLRGLFHPIRLVQVGKSIKSSKIEALGSPTQLFWKIIWQNDFQNNNLVPIGNLNNLSKCNISYLNSLSRSCLMWSLIIYFIFWKLLQISHWSQSDHIKCLCCIYFLNICVLIVI